MHMQTLTAQVVLMGASKQQPKHFVNGRALGHLPSCEDNFARLDFRN